MSTSVLVSTFPPFPTLSVSANLDTTLSDLYDLLVERYPDLPSSDSEHLDLFLSPHSGPLPSPDTPLASLLEDEDGTLLTLRLIPRLRGGKGGFGSQLRAAGGRMSSQKTSNNDSCRDLSGRRLSTIKEAKRLAEYIENEPARKKAQQEAQKAKLEALEKKLGIDRSSGSSSSDPLPPRKHRLDDTEYLEESKEIVDNVKSAVTAGLLKKKKKAKTSPSPPAAASSASNVVVAGIPIVSQDILTAPIMAPITAVASSA
ncbi:hypothetical protein PHLCEN_2v3792 [Hermanssonia centrifuga]|uniref:Uncharacterized protein n=1 Tax=Hermanssonia centrifuga TaxID=98765 RepID=A0A2R6QBL7_9APHY|nr:hypothetical protein PHLCEN_2v3792 [Hermanssonia centrifuga]